MNWFPGCKESKIALHIRIVLGRLVSLKLVQFLTQKNRVGHEHFGETYLTSQGWRRIEEDLRSGCPGFNASSFSSVEIRPVEIPKIWDISR